MALLWLPTPATVVLQFGRIQRGNRVGVDSERRVSNALLILARHNPSVRVFLPQKCPNQFRPTQKIQKVQPGVFARLAHTQQDEVFFNSLRRRKTFDGTAEPSKRFDGVLCVVVVPRDAIVAQKSEQFVSVSFQAILPFRRGRARESVLEICL